MKTTIAVVALLLSSIAYGQNDPYSACLSKSGGYKFCGDHVSEMLIPDKSEIVSRRVTVWTTLITYTKQNGEMLCEQTGLNYEISYLEDDYKGIRASSEIGRNLVDEKEPSMHRTISCKEQP